MSVTKQAAADAIGLLQSRRYLAREADPTDRRRVRLRVTAHGKAMLDEGDRVFDALRQDLEAKVGSPRLAQLEATLRQLVGDDIVRPGAPGTATDGISRERKSSGEMADSALLDLARGARRIRLALRSARA